MDWQPETTKLAAGLRASQKDILRRSQSSVANNGSGRDQLKARAKSSRLVHIVSASVDSLLNSMSMSFCKEQVAAVLSDRILLSLCLQFAGLRACGSSPSKPQSAWMSDQCYAVRPGAVVGWAPFCKSDIIVSIPNIR